MVSRQRGGFTLVEILIVVVILGILAAIVIPQFTNASESAKASSLIAQLQTIRSQLELFQVQHNGQYPTLAELNDTTNSAGGWGILVNKTTVAKAIDNTDGDFGPYLQQAPNNPFMQESAVVAAGSPADTAGWTYDASTGAVKAILPSTVTPADLGLGAADFEQLSGG